MGCTSDKEYPAPHLALARFPVVLRRSHEDRDLAIVLVRDLTVPWAMGKFKIWGNLFNDPFSMIDDPFLLCDGT